MKKISFIYLLALLVCSLCITGCDNNEKPAGIPAVSKKPVLMEPFRFHKLIEVSPGQDYDILSWGKGSKDTGSYMILHSDSAARKYTTTTGDLDGAIVDVYNSDMDMDGNPEILIQAKGKDTINYTNIYAFEFSNSKAQKLDFPKLTKTQKQGYRGDDNFYIEDGKFIREFPIYKGNGKDAKQTGQKRKLEYGLRDNSFTVKQLSKDSTNSVITKAAKIIPEKNTVPEKEHTSKKKHKSENHKPEKHKKKRRKHHHSYEE